MDWAAQYSAALDERDAREKAHKFFIDAYTKLADRRVTVGQQTKSAEATSDRQAIYSPSKEDGATQQDRESSGNEASLAQIRSELAMTQKARSLLQAQNDGLASTVKKLQRDHQAAVLQTQQLAKQRMEVERRLRDRDEELRGKTMLAETAQDEMVALSLQLNMAEQKSERLTRENKELVDRWMKRMGEEVDRVNRDSKWE